jgi:hypothetical protein
MATDGSRQSKLDRNDLLAEMESLLRTQANYVRGVCDGEAAKLQSSGFELNKVRERAGIPGIPIIKEARMTGHQGQVELRWTAEHGAKVYQVWMTESDPADSAKWVATAITSRVTYMVDGLQSYKAYWFAVSAIGAAGEGVKSDPTIARAA